MRTYADPDATALSMLDYTMPSDYALSSDCTGAPAWSSSPLGDPAVDDDEFFDLVDGYGPEEWGLKPRPFRTGVAIAAAVLGALGVGASLGIAIRDFAGPPPPTPALVIPAVAAPATPQPSSPTSAAPAPAPTVSPVYNAAPIPVVAPPNRPATTHRVVISSSNSAPAADPGPASAAGPADAAPPADPAPAPAAPAPHPSVVISIPPPPAPPFVPSKLIPSPPPVSIQIPLPAPFPLPPPQP